MIRDQLREAHRAATLRKVQAEHQIRDAIIDMGHTVDWDRGFVYLDGDRQMTACFEIREDYDRTGMINHLNGHLRAVLTGTGERKQQFPEPKAGFNPKKLASLIVETALENKRNALSQDQAREVARTARERALALSDAWNAENDGDGYEIGTVVAQQGKIHIELNVEPTDYQALAILRAVRSIIKNGASSRFGEPTS